MFAFIINLIMIFGAMWLFFRFMYPKPPKAFFAKAGDDTSERCCDFCGTPLATYRGILIPKDKPCNTDESTLIDYPFAKDDKQVVLDDCWFFCNHEHQQAFCQNQTSPNQPPP